MEVKILTKNVKGKTVDYLYLYVEGVGICVGFIDQFSRLHIKSK